MSRSNNKSSNTGSEILNTLQTEMCDVIYRHLFVLMKSLIRTNLKINLDKDKIIFFTISNDTDKYFDVYIQEPQSGNRHLSEINFSVKTFKDPILNLIIHRTAFDKCRPEKYAQWLENVKTTMQELLEEQKKYENILENVRSIPMFSPQREVLVEKK